MGLVLQNANKFGLQWVSREREMNIHLRYLLKSGREIPNVVPLQMINIPPNFQPPITLGTPELYDINPDDATSRKHSIDDDFYSALITEQNRSSDSEILESNPRGSLLVKQDTNQLYVIKPNKATPNYRNLVINSHYMDDFQLFKQKSNYFNVGTSSERRRDNHVTKKRKLITVYSEDTKRFKQTDDAEPDETDESNVPGSSLEKRNRPIIKSIEIVNYDVKSLPTKSTRSKSTSLMSGLPTDTMDIHETETPFSEYDDTDFKLQTKSDFIEQLGRDKTLQDCDTITVESNIEFTNDNIVTEVHTDENLPETTETTHTETETDGDEVVTLDVQSGSTEFTPIVTRTWKKSKHLLTVTKTSKRPTIVGNLEREKLYIVKTINQPPWPCIYVRPKSKVSHEIVLVRSDTPDKDTITVPKLQLHEYDESVIEEALENPEFANYKERLTAAKNFVLTYIKREN